MKKTLSSQQMAANRRNARKSTGPRTQQGRAVCRLNARKHGFLSREVLLPGRPGSEGGRELDALHRQFWEELQPVGAVEEMLVNQIVTAQWRWRRALAAEAGEIALARDEDKWAHRRAKHPALQWLEWEETGDPIHNMENSSRGCRLIERWLRSLRASVEVYGTVTEADIAKATGGRSNSLTREVEEMLARHQEKPEGVDQAAFAEENRQELLSHFDRELRLIGASKLECEEREQKAGQARQAMASVPSVATVNKLVRYETRLERQMFQALTRLEKLQQLRKGEVTPVQPSPAIA